MLKSLSCRGLEPCCHRGEEKRAGRGWRQRRQYHPRAVLAAREDQSIRGHSGAACRRLTIAVSAKAGLRWSPIDTRRSRWRRMQSPNSSGRPVGTSKKKACCGVILSVNLHRQGLSEASRGPRLWSACDRRWRFRI